MRNKVIGLGAVTLAVILAAVASIYNQTHIARYQQHLEAPGPSFQAEQGGEFRTHLPIISIDTGGQEIPGETRDGTTIPAALEVRDGGEGNNALTDAPVFASTALVRYRGNTSLHFDKKSYRLKLLQQDGQANMYSMLGMPKEDEWILNGPFLDKSLLRNYMMMNLSGQVMENAPEVRFCEVFVDGSYQGLYVMMESVSRSQVGIAKAVEGRAETSYVVRMDRGGHINLDNFTKYARIIQYRINVVYPTAAKITPEQLDYIQRDLSQFEKALYSLDYDDPNLGYRAYINVGAFVDYMVLNEFFQNTDAGIFSTYLNKPLGGKLSMGPVWDFNNALDNYMEGTRDGTGFSFVNNAWYFMLLKDPWFTQQVIQRYRQLRGTVLSEDYLMSYVDSTVAYLGDAVERNFSVWGYTFQPEHGLLEPAQRNIGSYDQAVAQVKDFLHRRGAWLDEHIELLYQYCHPSANKQYQH